MLKQLIERAWIVVTCAITPAIAYAGAAEEATQSWFYAADRSERTMHSEALQDLSNADNTAKFGLGTTQFFSAIEYLSQNLVRYGAVNQDSEFRDLIPFPLPKNNNPEPLTYEKLRELFSRFETRLETARATLSTVDQSKPVSIEISFVDARFDLVGADTINDEMRFANIINAMTNGGRSNQAGASKPSEGELRTALTFQFDNADAIWLEGYSNVLLSQVDFLLAHNFERAFNTSFQLFFPKSGLPLQNELIPDGYKGTGGMFGEADMIADAISLIHLMDWPVIEQARRADFARHMREVARLSNANWVAIRAETDNNREWLPGPQQPGKHPLTGIEVTDEMVTGWGQSMDLLDDLMSGKRLIPHWRFDGRGINLARYFESEQNFDPVLMLTGPGAIPFLEKGEIVTRQEWRAIQRAVGGRNFGMIAAWFN